MNKWFLGKKKVLTQACIMTNPATLLKEKGAKELHGMTFE